MASLAKRMRKTMQRAGPSGEEELAAAAPSSVAADREGLLAEQLAREDEASSRQAGTLLCVH
jgi:hypothetical protein